MRFEDFRQSLKESICFNRNKVLAWYPGFDKNNFGRWVEKGYLVKLRNGYYVLGIWLGSRYSVLGFWSIYQYLVTLNKNML